MTHPRLLMIGMEKNTFDRLQVMCRANMVPLSTLYVINKNAVFFFTKYFYHFVTSDKLLCIKFKIAIKLT